jgi:hypothetical protein
MREKMPKKTQRRRIEKDSGDISVRWSGSDPREDKRGKKRRREEESAFPSS